MAPSVNSPLHPIVIPEIVVQPHFTCLGSGLLQNGHPRESPSALGALLLPSPAAPRGIPNSAKSKTWWRAQCLHYGIDMPVSATIDRMRARLEEGLRGYGGLVVPGELLDLEHKKCGEFRKLNAQVRDKISGVDGSAKEKAKPAAKPAAKPKKEATEMATARTVADGGSGKGKAKPPAKAKKEATEVVTTTTITTTTTTMRGSAPAGLRGGSGAGAAKAAKVEKAAKAAKSAKASGVRDKAVKSSGVSKPKQAVKKEAKKEVKKEDEDGLYHYPPPSREEILRQQQAYLNTTNYTSNQGPLPSYLSGNQPRPTWQTQPAPTPGYESSISRSIEETARYSGPPRGGSAGSNGRSKWIPQSDGTFKQFGAPRGGRYGGGAYGGSRYVSSTYTHQNQHPLSCKDRTTEEMAPPPAYGSWIEDEYNNDMGDDASDYSDGAEFTAVRYEDFDILLPEGGTIAQSSTMGSCETNIDDNWSGRSGSNENLSGEENDVDESSANLALHPFENRWGEEEENNNDGDDYDDDLESEQSFHSLESYDSGTAEDSDA